MHRPRVQGLFDSFLPLVRLIPIDQAILSLRGAYISAGILTPKSAEDAAHVASATLARADPDCELELPPHGSF